jgi:hypothetical protein
LEEPRVAISKASKAAYDKARRAAKHDELLAIERKRRAAQTPEEVEQENAYLRAWRLANPAKVKEANRELVTSGYKKGWRDATKAKDPEKWRRQERAVRIKSKYGISIDDYDSMVVAQGGACAICRRAETMKIKGTLVMLAIDRDHDTGRVRGLLCVNCNMLIGGAHHDVATLRAAIAYLQSQPAAPADAT